MSKANLVIVALILIGVSIGCKSFLPGKETAKSNDPAIDFTTAANGLDVKVQVDKNQTASGKVSPGGGSVSLPTADGSKFTLDVPANAVDSETTITMTAVKSVEGAPLDSTTPTAVQLEPSGLRFKEIATLTITLAKEIPIEKQIIFGYEGNGKDYHLAPVDPSSKEIKVKLMGFSGAGVGIGGDTAWAAHLMIEANGAKPRLLQKIAEVTQTERRAAEEGTSSKSTQEIFKPFLDAFYEQVVLKEIAAAELDCKHAQAAANDLHFHERYLQLVGLADSATGSPGFKEKGRRLAEIYNKCKKSYRVNGQSAGASFTGEICSLDKPFTINVESITGNWPMEFTPSDELSGQMTGTISSSGCTQSGGGPYTISIGEDGSGTITFTYNSTATCPGGSTTRSKTSTLPLRPAPELSCP